MDGVAADLWLANAGYLNRALPDARWEWRRLEGKVATADSLAAQLGLEGDPLEVLVANGIPYVQYSGREENLADALSGALTDAPPPGRPVIVRIALVDRAAHRAELRLSAMAEAFGSLLEQRLPGIVTLCRTAGKAARSHRGPWPVPDRGQAHTRRGRRIRARHLPPPVGSGVAAFRTRRGEARLAVTEELEGRIQSVVFRGDGGEFSVVRLLRDGSPDPITATGYLAGTAPGERVRLKGDWETHPRYGRQFRVSECLPLLPATSEGIEAYLGSGLVEGIGPEMARRIVRRFGEDALRVIDEEPARLAEVPGIGPKRIAAVGKAWQDQRGIREAMLFLQSNGVSPAYAARIYRQYGNRAVQVVRENPYRLAEDVAGIGFLTADRFARGLGIAEDSPLRAEAGILHALQKSSEEGHLFLPSTELLERSQRMLECGRKGLAEALERLIASWAGCRGGYRGAGAPADAERGRRLDAARACSLPSGPPRGGNRDRA